MRNGRTWAAAVLRRLGRGRADGERGAVLVEAAIVIPILMMITLGIIEYGSAYQQDAAVAAASRAGARVASAMSKTAFSVTTTTSGDGSVVTIQAVQAALQSVGNATPVQMEIYRVQSGCTAPSFSGCTYKINFKWNSSTKAWGTPTGTAWPATKQYACPTGAGPDQIGIWVQMTHKGVTKMFGGDKTLTGTTIMRLEPSPDSSTCGVS